jgi:hypothetical protein
MAIMPLHTRRFQRHHRHVPRTANGLLLRLNAGRLDADLAAGCSPESTPRHEARARHLVDPQMRNALASSWEHLLAVTARQTRGLSGRAPLQRERVHRAEREIRDLIAALRTTGPIPVRGVAIATTLLTDGCGPVYNRNAPNELTAMLDLAIEQMDPELPLAREPGECPRD